MSNEEFRELVKAVQDKMATVRIAQPTELDREVCGLQSWVRKLRECQWPKRLSDADRVKGIYVMTRANELIAEVMV